MAQRHKVSSKPQRTPPMLIGEDRSCISFNRKAWTHSPLCPRLTMSSRIDQIIFKPQRLHSRTTSIKVMKLTLQKWLGKTSADTAS